MAWIIGLVSAEELKKLKEIGWHDEDPPAELYFEDLASKIIKNPHQFKTRAFYVDSDVFTIMTGRDWEPRANAFPLPQIQIVLSENVLPHQGEQK